MNVAILIRPENFDKILATESIAPADLTALEEDARSLKEKRYFVPSYTTLYGYATRSWASIRHDYLLEAFEYDNDKIRTEFVEIKHK